jgi:hypothetical protein
MGCSQTSNPFERSRNTYCPFYIGDYLCLHVRLFYNLLILLYICINRSGYGLTDENITCANSYTLL